MVEDEMRNVLKSIKRSQLHEHYITLDRSAATALVAAFLSGLGRTRRWPVPINLVELTAHDKLQAGQA